MPYHHKPKKIITGKTNIARKVAPPGYHYMPDGTLMSDADHARLSSGGTSGKIKASSNSKVIFLPVFRICSYNLVTTYNVTTTQNPIEVIYDSSNPWMIRALTDDPSGANYPISFINYFNQIVAQTGPLVPGDKIVMDNNVLQPSGTGGGVDLSGLSSGAVSGIANKFCLEYLGDYTPPQATIFPGNYSWLGGWFVSYASVQIFDKFDCCKSFINPGPLQTHSWDCVTTVPNIIIGEVSPENLYNTFGSIQQCVEVIGLSGQFQTENACLKSGCGTSSPTNTIPISPMPMIKNFDCDFGDIQEAGETREFSITGDNGAEFHLEIKNEDSYYYNFTCNEFQSTYNKLDGVIENGIIIGGITFPTVTDADQYDIYLYAKPGTKHVDLDESLFKDGSVDYNNSRGSNSLLLRKVMYQILDVTATFSSYSPTSTITLSGSLNDTVELGRYRSSGKAFSLTGNVTSNAISVDRQPIKNDLLGLVDVVVGAAPIDISGENIYPTARDAFTGDDIDGAITSGSVVRMDAVDLSAVIAVGDKITTTVMTDTVNGDFSGGATAITMDAAVATKMAVGDRVTGNAVLAAGFFTVATIDSTNVFSLDASAAIDDGTTLSFSSKINRSVTTVTVVETSGTATDFTMSQAIQFRDNAPLTFWPRKNYQWPVDNVNNLAEDMIVVASGNVLASTTLSKYEDITTIDACTENEREIINVEKPAIDKSQIPTIVNGIVTTHAGNIIFNQQQPLALAGDTIKIGGYGLESIASLTGWDIEINNLKAEVNAVTTTTTADTSASASTTVSVASVLGISDVTTQTVNLVGDELKRYGLTNNTTVLDSVDGLNVGQRLRAMSVGTLSGNPTITKINTVSKLVTFSVKQTFADGETLTFSNSDVSGIGVDSSVIDPYVTNISSLDLTVSVAQALESGQTLTFGGSGNIVTITGNILVKKAGPLDLALYFDVEKFLTYHS